MSLINFAVVQAPHHITSGVVQAAEVHILLNELEEFVRRGVKRFGHRPKRSWMVLQSSNELGL